MAPFMMITTVLSMVLAMAMSMMMQMLVMTLATEMAVAMHTYFDARAVMLRRSGIEAFLGCVQWR